MGTQYRNDIFISYAKADDFPLDEGNTNSGWVSSFVRNLEHRISFELGDAVKIWQDIHNFEGNERFDDIFDQIHDSALLFIILSPNYLNRPWTLEERIEFFKKAGKNSAPKRVYLVRTRALEDRDIPNDLQEFKGYKFFKEDPKGSTRLGDPPGGETDEEYYKSLINVARDAANDIRIINRDPVPKSDRVVFLADTHPNLRSERTALRVMLNDNGFTVLPNQFIDPDPKTLRHAISPDLKNCTLFVQLLGEQPYLDRIQFDAASDAGVDKMLWRPRSLFVDPDSEPMHKELLQAATSGDLEDFKTAILAKLNKQAIAATLPSASKCGRSFVLIKAGPGDERLADQASGKLSDQGVDCEILEGDTSLKDAASIEEYAGLVVTLSQHTKDWARDELKGLRTMAIKQKHSSYGTYREGDCIVPLRFKGLHVLPDNWAPFLDDLR